MNSTLIEVTNRIQRRSRETRAAYLERMHRAESEGAILRTGLLRVAAPTKTRWLGTWRPISRSYLPTTIC
jgi:hypothetical protein